MNYCKPLKMPLRKTNRRQKTTNHKNLRQYQNSRLSRKQLRNLRASFSRMKTRQQAHQSSKTKPLPRTHSWHRPLTTRPRERSMNLWMAKPRQHSRSVPPKFISSTLRSWNSSKNWRMQVKRRQPWRMKLRIETRRSTKWMKRWFSWSFRKPRLPPKSRRTAWLKAHPTSYRSCRPSTINALMPTSGESLTSKSWGRVCSGSSLTFMCSSSANNCRSTTRAKLSKKRKSQSRASRPMIQARKLIATRWSRSR